jgi:hypothetical protein
MARFFAFIEDPSGWIPRSQMILRRGYGKGPAEVARPTRPQLVQDRFDFGYELGPLSEESIHRKLDGKWQARDVFVIIPK